MADRYVDNINGNDSYDGLTVATAYATIQKALDNTNGANGDCVFIKKNATTPYSIIQQININTGCGNYGTNKWKQVIGYDNAANCDFMNRKSDLDVVDDYVQIDAGNGNFHLFQFYENQYNIIFRNLEPINISDDYYCWDAYYKNGCRNLSWQHCKAHTNRIIRTDGINNLYGINSIINCDFAPQTSSGDMKIYSVKWAVINSKLKNINTGTNNYTFVLLVNCQVGFVGVRSAAMCINCTIVSDNYDGITTQSISDASFFAFNNILYGNAISNAFDISAGSGIHDYNCLYNWADNYVGNASQMPNEIIQNPDFQDAQNENYRAKNPSVLRGGIPDMQKNPTQMGAVQSKYQFMSKAKTANYGKLAIFK